VVLKEVDALEKDRIYCSMSYIIQTEA